jgi:enoyl-CoA hydratase/carnithine racemase
MSAYKNILIAKKAETCHISLNNPKKLNARSSDTLKEISKACDEISLNKKIKIVVFSSSSMNFSAGADLRESNRNKSVEDHWHENTGRRCINSIINLPQISICLIEGYCLGGGAVIATACDFRIAETNSLFGYPEIELGMNLSWLGLPLAIGCLGLSEAKHVILSGEKFSALEMQNKGFLNEIFDLEEKNKCLKKWINKFKKMPRLQLKMIKKSANELAFSQAKSIMHMEFDQFLLSRND